MIFQKSLHDVGKINEHHLYSCSEFMLLDYFFFSVSDAFLQIRSFTKWWHSFIFLVWCASILKKTHNISVVIMKGTMYNPFPYIIYKSSGLFVFLCGMPVHIFQIKSQKNNLKKRT